MLFIYAFCEIMHPCFPLVRGGVGDLEIFFGRGRGVGLKMKRGITYMSRYQEGVIEYECQFFYLNG